MIDGPAQSLIDEDQAPVAGGDEPLTGLSGVPALVLHPDLMRVPGRARLRAGVVDRLLVAQLFLPLGLHLVIMEAYRSPADRHPLCPHTTGAAVHVTAGAPGAVVGTDPLRGFAGTVLHHALRRAGFVPRTGADGHWSFGDADWAVATGTAKVHYGDHPAGAMPRIARQTDAAQLLIRRPGSPGVLER